MHLNPAINALLEGLNNPSLPGVDLSLDRMRELLAALGNPQEKLPPVIHIAGTNGKGSTLAFLRGIYAAAGYYVHAYTSPHLVKFNERIVLGGREITDEQLLPYLQRVAEAAKTIPVTFFEATTAAAFLAFAQFPAHAVLLETGLGGRLDATNLVDAPALTVITPIALDHMEFLGETVEAIAAEKAGIIKPGVRCVVGQQSREAWQVLKDHADALDAPFVAFGTVWRYAVDADGIEVRQGSETWRLPLPPLAGAHQHHNAALASVAAKNCEALPITNALLAEGIARSVWPARLQKLSHGPLVDAWGDKGDVYLDGGHNAHAAEALAPWVSANQPVTLVCGMMRRKDAVSFLKPFAGQVAKLITVTIPGQDAFDVEALAAQAREAGIAHAQACAWDALPTALQQISGGTLLIAGSLFLSGELLKNHG